MKAYSKLSKLDSQFAGSFLGAGGGSGSSGVISLSLPSLPQAHEVGVRGNAFVRGEDRNR